MFVRFFSDVSRGYQPCGLYPLRFGFSSDELAWRKTYIPALPEQHKPVAWEHNKAALKSPLVAAVRMITRLPHRFGSQLIQYRPRHHYRCPVGIVQGSPPGRWEGQHCHANTWPRRQERGIWCTQLWSTPRLHLWKGIAWSWSCGPISLSPVNRKCTVKFRDLNKLCTTSSRNCSMSCPAMAKVAKVFSGLSMSFPTECPSPWMVCIAIIKYPCKHIRLKHFRFLYEDHYPQHSVPTARQIQKS